MIGRLEVLFAPVPSLWDDGFLEAHRVAQGSPR